MVDGKVLWCSLATVVALTAPLAQGQCPDFNGTLAQGGFIWGTVAPGSTVTLAGESLDVLADGTTFAGFGRDAPATSELVVSGPRPDHGTSPVTLSP